MPSLNEYVVDVLIPIAIAVRAPDVETAAVIAVEQAIRQGVIERIEASVDADDSDFVRSDSTIQTEVGEG